MVDKMDLRGAYNAHVQHQSETIADRDQALKNAIGAEFEAFGVIEREMLIHYGLQKDASLIDVGCGSGRLAIPLSKWLTGPYLGTDLVQDLLDFAKGHVRRPDWRFELANGLKIDAPDQSVDMVCFFSVLTHLLHEQSYLYLEEAARVLKPGGRVVFSFLEFSVVPHWTVFENTLRDTRGDNRHPLNVFISRDGILAWTAHLGLTVGDIRDGGDRFVPLPHPLTLDSGEILEGFGNLGQSICMLEKPAFV